MRNPELKLVSLLALAMSANGMAQQNDGPRPAPELAQPAAVSYGGGDGSTPEQAVIIQTRAGGAVGVRAEYAWLGQRFPGYQRGRQAVLKFDGKTLDMIEITTADGQQRRVFFDVTAFFGKY